MVGYTTPTYLALKRAAFIVSDTVFEVDTATINPVSLRQTEILPVDGLRKPIASAYLVSGSGSLLGLLPILSGLATSPVVLHIAVVDDLSEVMRLHSSVPFFFHSYGGQQAYDNALLASTTARIAQKPVVHAYHPGTASDAIHELAEEEVKGLCQAEAATPEELPQATYERATVITQFVTGRSILPFELSGVREAPFAAIVLGYPESVSAEPGAGLVIRMSLLSPFPERALRAALASVKRVVVLDQVLEWTLKWTPLFLSIANTLQSWDEGSRPALTTRNDGSEPLSDIITSGVSARAPLGPPSLRTPDNVHIPSHESSYTDILNHLFEDRLQILNDPTLAKQPSPATASPEFALGRARQELEERADLVSAVRHLLEDPQTPADLHAHLSRWLCSKDDPAQSKAYGDKILEALATSGPKQEQSARVLALRFYLPARSRWIIGSDAWSYDIGASGLHHAIASGLNVNVLVLDNIPYSTRNADPNHRKQDVGLYAMNHGDVYVASVALYASHGQVLQALTEADAYPGPSIVLAYLPYTQEDDPVSSLLKETKDAVDSGYWPLYRWDPSRETRGEEVFQLDSVSVKQELQAFLDRQNHISQLVRNEPQLATNVVNSVGESIRAARKSRAQAAYADLLAGIDAPPIIILYASDGGNAENKARRLAHRAKARGLSATLSTLDSFGLDAVAKEENVVFITSTAGQGEPPQNGRAFFKAANAAAAKAERPFANLKYTVFGMGDSHYWPRPEDAGYYNRPSKELDVRLAQLGGERFSSLGLGDEQDADGAETGYKVWEPLVWKHFKVDTVEVEEAEPEPITAEHIKAASNYLRGTIAEGLADPTTGALAESDTTLTKFHGVYQQDDRDVREERQAVGIEPAYIFMIRVRMPGGAVTPEQLLTIDQIADEYGAGNYKMTSRQNIQIHGVLKRDLKASIQRLNVALMDSLAAGGDGNRNVLVTVIPTLSKLHEQVYAFGKRISEYLLPRTGAYHEIWLDKKLVAGDALHDHEPLFRDTFYLPRKIKFAIAVPPINDIDVFSNCVGFIAIVDDNGDLAGFNVAVGGGMGFTHGAKKTYPRVADVIGFITPDKGMAVVETIFLFHRDNSNRQDRKNARLKYTIDRIGVDVFKSEIEKMLGFPFEPARSFAFTRNTDTFGWQTGIDGKHHFTCYIENGRVRDTSSHPFKLGLREIAKVHKGGFRFTANQHVVITDVTDEELPEIKRLLAQYKLDNVSLSGLRLSSSACVALPTCPIAMAESERYFPILLSKIEAILEENGLRDDAIVARMSGCPNSCSRPSLAELGFIGKAPGSYLMLLGGGHRGERLSKIYRESVTEPEILAILKPMIKGYALERLDGESFGDFVVRGGYIAPMTAGTDWYEHIGGEASSFQRASLAFPIPYSRIKGSPPSQTGSLPPPPTPLLRASGDWYNRHYCPWIRIDTTIIISDVRDFGEPFNTTDADIILRSIDDIDFGAHRAVLAQGSPLFASLFSLPPPASDPSTIASKDEQKDGKPVISMAEDKDALHHLLILCYPAFPPALDSMDELSLTLRVAQKYELPCASSIAKYTLLSLASSAPERAYALGWIIRSKEVVHHAARESLARPLLDIGPQPEFAQLPGSAVFELLAYHRLCLRSVTGISTSLGWLNPASLPAAKLQWQNIAGADNTGRCNCNLMLVSITVSGGVELWVKPWCKTYLDTAVRELQQCVRGSTVKKFKVLREAVVSGVMDCETCKSNCFEALDKISDLLA